MASERLNVPILSVAAIGRRLPSGWIWHDISFDLFPGDRLAIVGPSGAGKSLLLRALAGLDPIQKGIITVQGTRLSRWKMPQLRTQVMYLHQQSALFEGTVEANLKQVYGLASHRDRTYDRAQIIDYLSSLGRSADFLDRSTEQLSGGERQLVTFLRALQLSPKILLLDEPSASLDAAATQRLEALIDQWQRSDRHTACIWTSHDPAQIDRVTHRKLVLSGTVGRLAQPPIIRQVEAL